MDCENITFFGCVDAAGAGYCGERGNEECVTNPVAGIHAWCKSGGVVRIVESKDFHCGCLEEILILNSVFGRFNLVVFLR